MAGGSTPFFLLCSLALSSLLLPLISLSLPSSLLFSPSFSPSTTARPSAAAPPCGCAHGCAVGVEASRALSRGGRWVEHWVEHWASRALGGGRAEHDGGRWAAAGSTSPITCSASERRRARRARCRGVQYVIPYPTLPYPPKARADTCQFANISACLDVSCGQRSLRFLSASRPTTWTVLEQDGSDHLRL